MRLMLLLAFLGVASSAFAQDAITIPAPVAVAPVSNYTPQGIDIRVSPDPQILVYLRDTNSKEEVFSYPCPTGGPCTFTTPASVQTLINQLNTANLATRSLWKRVFDRLCADFPSRFPGGCSVP